MGLLLLVAFLFLLSWGLLRGYRWLTTSAYFDIENIEIQGNEHLKKSEILKKANLHRGQNSLKINIEKIKNSLVSMPWTKEVLVKRKLPNEMFIRIREKQPYFWIRTREQIYYAKANGEVIAPLRVKNLVSLPVLYYNKKDSEQKKYLEYLKRQLCNQRRPFSLAQISWIDFLSREILELFLRDFGILIRIGTEKLHSNYKFLKRVWKDLAKRKELSAVETIYIYQNKGWVGFKNQVVSN